ncbi:hypothetical protein KC350_g27 [Hortaea werneckii]|nr:hypothetical protein KC350_g27 [Hortaea werneckii]
MLGPISGPALEAIPTRPHSPALHASHASGPVYASTTRTLLERQPQPKSSYPIHLLLSPANAVCPASLMRPDFLRDPRQRHRIFPLLFQPAHQPSEQELCQDEDIHRDADAVVRVRQAPLGANGEVSQHEDDGQEEDGEDLEVDVDFDRGPGVPPVELRHEDGGGHDGEEDDGGQHAVAQDQLVVAWQVGEAVAHAVVSHRLEVEAHEVGEQEGVAAIVPGAVADVQVRAKALDCVRRCGHAAAVIHEAVVMFSVAR